MFEAWDELGKIARLGGDGELVLENVTPCVTARRGRAGQSKQISAIGNARQCTRLQSRCAYFLIADGTKNLAKAFNFFIKTAPQCLNGDISGGDTRAAGGDDDVNGFIVDALLELFTDFFFIIGDDGVMEDFVSALGGGFFEILS